MEKLVMMAFQTMEMPLKSLILLGMAAPNTTTKTKAPEPGAIVTHLQQLLKCHSSQLAIRKMMISIRLIETLRRLAI